MLLPITKSLNRQSTSPSSLDWPATQAAAGVLGTDLLNTHGEQKPAAMASTAKVITALVVLDKKPLKLNEQGPSITLTAEDVARYNTYRAQDGSIIPVAAGVKITEYQALQAIMLPSANNIADAMAIWAYGSLPDYSKAANVYLKKNDLKNTRVGSDASGLAPDTTSTASDLAKIGKLAMQNQVIAQVVGQTKATGIPLTTVVTNYNSLLGRDGIVGIKTGNSDQAGGAFVGAAETEVNGQKQIVVTAVMNAANLSDALRQSLNLIRSARTNFSSIKVVNKGQPVGYYNLPWGGRVSAIATNDLNLSLWNGSTLSTQPKLYAQHSTTRQGHNVGTLVVRTSSTSNIQNVPLGLESSFDKPTLLWRLTHPF